MNYQEAFFEIVNQYGLEILREHFLVRSLFSDYIGSSFDDNQLLNAYFLMNEHQLIYEIVRNRSIDESKDEIKKIISSQSKKYTVYQYIKSIEPIYMLVHSNKYTPLEDPKKKVVGQHINVVKNRPANAVINNVVRNPQNNKVTPFDSIYIDIVNSGLNVLFVKNRKRIRIYDGDDKKPTKVRRIYKNNAVYINFKKEDSKFLVEIPIKLYDKLVINQTDGSITVNSDEKVRTIVRNLDITADYSFISVGADITNINIKQNNGYLFQSGNFYKLKFRAARSDVYLYPNGGHKKDIDIEIQRGDIQIRSYPYKVKPKINHLFKKVTYVDGEYQLGQLQIKLHLSTNKGKIKVC